MAVSTRGALAGPDCLNNCLSCGVRMVVNRQFRLYV